MSIYAPRKSGRGIYGTGYDGPPVSTLPDAGRVIQQSLPRLPEPQIQEEPIDDPETDPSILRQAADTSLSGLSMLGNFLDLPGSTVRDVMTWLPGGISARNPLDQWLTPFSDVNRTSGEDILKNAGVYDEDNSDDGLAKSVGKFLGATALELGADPLTYLTLGASALGKGGKLAKAAGLMDDATKVASRKAGAEVGMRRAKQLVSPRELAENVAGDVGRERLLNAYNAAPEVLKGRAAKAASFDDIPAELLDKSIGGNMRWKLPFMEEKIINDIKLPGGHYIGAGLSAVGNMASSIPIPRTGKTLGEVTPDWVQAVPKAIEQGVLGGEMIAELGDQTAEAIRYGKYSPVRLAAPYFSRAVHGAKSKFAQKGISDIERRIQEQSQLARDVSINFIKRMHDGSYFKPNEKIVGNTPEETLRLRNLDIMERSNAMMDYLEGTAKTLPDAMAGEQQTLDRMRELMSELNDLNREFAVNTGELGPIGIKMRQLDTDGNELLDADGIPLPGVDIPSPYEYFPRDRQFTTGPLWKALHNGRRISAKDGYGIRREDYTRHLPTSVIQQMSVDPEFAGVFDRGVMGRRGGFKDWFKGTPDTGTMGSTPVDPEARETLRAKFFEKYNPAAYIDPEYLKDELVVDALNKRHTELFDSITQLNREQATKGMPMYAVNPAENLLHRLDSGYMQIASTVGGRDLLTQAARLRPDSRFNPDRQTPPPQPPLTPPTAGGPQPRGIPPTPTTPVIPKPPVAPRPPKGASAARRETERIRQLSADQWTELDVAHIATKENFASISAAHKRLDAQLDQLVKQRGMRKEDASIARLIFAQTELPYEMDAVRASRKVTFDGRKANKDAIGTAYYERDLLDSTGKVWLKSASKTDEGARDKGATTLLHEFAHIVWFKARDSNNALHQSLVKEFKELTDKQPDQNFLDEFVSAGNDSFMADYFTFGVKGPDNKQIERFAEFFSDSTLRRKLPPNSKLGQLIDGAMQWLKDKLIKLGAVKGLDPDVRKRLDEIVDELGGFNATQGKQANVSAALIDDILRNPIATTGPVSEVADTAGTQASTKAQAGDSGKAFNLVDQVKAMGLDYDEGKAALVQSLPESQRIIDATQDERIQSVGDALYKMLEKTNPNDVPDADDLLEALRSDPDRVREIIGDLDDEKLFDKATALIDSLDRPVPMEDVLKEFEIDAEIGGDLARFNKAFSGSEESTALAAAWDAFTNMFKGNVTAPFPSFHVRNAMSAFVQNALNDIHDPTQSGWRKYVQPYKDAKDLMNGKAIKDASKIPLFDSQRQAWTDELKRQLGDKFDESKLDALLDDKATAEIRRLIFSRKLVDSPGDHNDIVGNIGGSVADQLIGNTPFSDRVKRPDGVNWLDTITPWKTPGVSGGENAFAPIRYGRVVGDMTEQAVRSAPFIALLKQGVDPDEAARMVKRLHVDYSNLTDFERKRIRRAVPFYGFQKGATQYLASELAQKPGGKIAMTIKGAENASGDDPGAPAYIRAGANIPLGFNAEGGQEYLVGAGLMHEPPVQMLAPSVAGTLFNVASVLHPGIKFPIELATNESLFQEGSGGGGRSLDDMDPLLGRTLSNIGNTLGLTDRETPVNVPGGKLTEAVIANTPIARYLHQVRKATDPRKSLTTRAIDGLTGFKITTVDPEDSDAVLREQAEQLMRELGGRDFSHAYMPDNVMASLQGDELEKAQQLQALLKQLNNRQRQRAGV